MIIYLLRHGTTSWNSLYKIQGISDIPLDPQGEAIARATGEALKDKGIRFDHIFSSPLSRARRTAELVAPGQDITTDPRLAELCFGDYEGRTVPEMIEDPSCVFRFFQADPFRYNEEVIRLNSRRSENHYESLEDLLQRTDSFIKEIIDPLALTEPDDSHVLIVGHGALNKGLLMSFSKNKDLRSFWGKGLQKNCGINQIVSRRDPDGSFRYDVDQDHLLL